MARFSVPIVLALMRTMLPRAPACFFTEEDIDKLERETGLNRKQIEQWEQNFRYRTLDVLRQARLGNAEKDYEQVKPPSQQFSPNYFLGKASRFCFFE